MRRLLAIALLLSGGAWAQDWYNPLWLYRVPVEVQATGVPSDQTDFTVKLDLANMPAGFHANVNQTDARDIRVTKSDGTTEVAADPVYYDSTTDTGLLAYMADGTLSSTLDTVYYIYYGNVSATRPAATATYGQYNAYDANWAGYWPEGGLGNRVSASWQGTVSGTVVTGDSAGQIGAATEYTGSPNHIVIGDLDTPDEMTVMVWASYTVSTNKYFLGKDHTTSWMINAGTGATFWTSNAFNSMGGTNDGSWRHLVGTFVSGTRTAYRDGASVSSSGSQTMGTDDDDLTFGRTGAFDIYYSGYMQEISIHFIALSADRILTEYNQTDNNAAFIVPGAQEDVPSGGLLLRLMTEGLFVR